MEELLTLVDADDNDIGFAEKIQVHREGLLHRAFSIFSEPVPEPSEVGEWQWMDTQDVLESMRSSPDNFTVWFRQIVEQVGASGLDAWRGDLPGAGMQDARSI